MVYARVHDRTVADDYFRALATIEGRVDGCDALATPEVVREELEMFLGRMKEMKNDTLDTQLEEVDKLRDEMLKILQRWAL